MLPVACVSRLLRYRFIPIQWSYNRYGTWVPKEKLSPDQLKPNIANVDCVYPNTTDKCFPCLPTSSKLILSNSLTLPLQEEEKSKTFTTPNCFAVITSDIIEYNIFSTLIITRNDNTENILILSTKLYHK